MKKWNREALAEPLFFFAYVVFMVATVLQTTMYTEMRYFPQLFIAMRYFAFIVAAVKVLLDLYGDLRKVNGQREKMMDWVSVVIKYVLMSALVVAVSVTADERSLAFLLVILLAARGVMANKIFRVTLWMQAFLAAKAGADYAAPYINRIDNLGADGIATAKIIQDMFTKNGLKCSILAASFKNSQQVQALAQYGVGAATIAPAFAARNACIGV